MTSKRKIIRLAAPKRSSRNAATGKRKLTREGPGDGRVYRRTKRRKSL